MADNNKQLEIGVVVNDQQMGKFKNSIREATIEVQKLAEGLNRAASAFKGFLSGARTGAGNFQPGSGFSRAPMAGGGGVGQPVMAIASAIKSSAKESNDALKFLETGVRSSSSKMVGDIVNLDRVLANVEKRFKNIRNVTNGNAMIPGVGQGGGGSGSSFIPPDSKIVNRGGVDYVQGERSAFRRLLDGEDVGGNMKTLRRLVPFGLAARGIQSLGNEVAAQPNDWMAQQSRIGNSFGSVALAMQQGRDFTTNYAQKRIEEENRARGNLGLNAKQRMQIAQSYADAAIKTGKVPESMRNALIHNGLDTMARGSGPGNASSDQLGNSSLFNNIWAGIKAVPSSIGAMSAGPAFRAIEGADTEESIRKQEYAQKYAQAHQADVGFRARNTYAATWESDIGLMRQLGVSDVRTLAARLRGGGFSTGDLASGQQSVAALGGWGNRGLGYTAMHATAGHVDVGNLLGATAQAGGNGRQLASYIAGLGIDPHAQTAIANALTGQAMNGGPMIDQTGTLAALSAFNGRGSSPGEQMRIASGQAGGLNAINSDVFGGGIDNLQKGRNIVNAISATDGNNLFGSQYLADHFNFGMLANAQHGGKLSSSLESRGLTNAQVKKYGDLTFGSMFRNIMVGGTGTPMGQLASQMIGGDYGSDIGKFIRDHRKDKGFNVDKTLKTFGSILATEGYGGGNEQVAEGIARNIAGLTNMGKLKPGSFKDASSGTNQRKTGKAVSENDAETAAHIKNMTPEEAAKTPGSVARGYQDIAGNVGASADAVAQRLSDLADSIELVTRRIEHAGYVK